MSKKTDPRVIRTRSMFEQALLDLLEENDFPKITVEKIARKAGLNRATFYLHYFDKEDLLEQFLTRSLKELQENVQIIDAEFRYSSNYPHPMFIRLFEQMQENHQFFKIMLAHKRIPYMIDAVTEIIQTSVSDANDWMMKDGIQFTVPYEIRTAYVIHAYLGVIIWWLNHDMPYSPKYMATQLTVISTVGPFVTNPYIPE